MKWKRRLQDLHITLQASLLQSMHFLSRIAAHSHNCKSRIRLSSQQRKTSTQSALLFFSKMLKFTHAKHTYCHSKVNSQMQLFYCRTQKLSGSWRWCWCTLHKIAWQKCYSFTIRCWYFCCLSFFSCSRQYRVLLKHN